MDDLLRMAEVFASEKHKGQVDRAGKEYILHPKAVADSVEGVKEKIVAWLHDTVEDGGATVSEIREIFGDDVADAVSCLTHDLRVPYMEYIRGIKKNELARVVKLADLKHNMDLSRLDSVSDEDLKRVEKYKRAYEFLK